MIFRGTLATRFIRSFCTSEIRHSSTSKVWMRPYDPIKYEVPAKQLKPTTGYAFLDVDPMPRATLMKLCYHYINKLQKIPENANIRLYDEERIRYYMELVEETENVRNLEKKLGTNVIELFIQDLKEEYLALDSVIEQRLWEEDTDHTGELGPDYLESATGSKYGQFAVERRNEIEYLEKEATRMDQQFEDSQKAKIE